MKPSFAKNYCNRTLLKVIVIVKNVVTCFWGHSHSSRIRFLRFFENPKKRDFLRFLKCHVKKR